MRYMVRVKALYSNTLIGLGKYLNHSASIFIRLISYDVTVTDGHQYLEYVVNGSKVLTFFHEVSSSSSLIRTNLSYQAQYDDLGGV